MEPHYLIQMQLSHIPIRSKTYRFSAMDHLNFVSHRDFLFYRLKQMINLSVIIIHL